MVRSGFQDLNADERDTYGITDQNLTCPRNPNTFDVDVGKSVGSIQTF